MDPNAATKCKGHKPSPEDMKVFKELRRDAMIYGAIPVAAGLGATTWFAVKKGLLKTNPKYGAIPKVLAAVVVGDIIGFVTYMRSNWAERFKGKQYSPFAGGFYGGFKHRNGCSWTKSDAEKKSSSEQAQHSEGQGQPAEIKH